MAQQQLVKEERSLGDLFSELASETSTLVRQEVALAQTELTQKATVVGKDSNVKDKSLPINFPLALSGGCGFSTRFPGSIRDNRIEPFSILPVAVSKIP